MLGREGAGVVADDRDETSRSVAAALTRLMPLYWVEVAIEVIASVSASTSSCSLASVSASAPSAATALVLDLLDELGDVLGRLAEGADHLGGGGERLAELACRR